MRGNMQDSVGETYKLTASSLKELNNSYQSGYLSEEGEAALDDLMMILARLQEATGAKGGKNTLGTSNAQNKSVKKVPAA